MKKTGMSKLHIVLLLLALAAAAAVITAAVRTGLRTDAGGSAGQEGKTADKSGEDTGETVPLKWYVNFTWFNSLWGQNAVTRKITEKTGATVDYVVPSGNEEEKLNALIAGDSLPDLITLGWWEPQVETLIKNGYVAALTQLAGETDSAFLEEADPDILNWYRQKDGEVYCYPNSSFKPEDYKDHDIASTQTFVVRKDLYEALGCPDMTTPEGFAKAVREAAKRFPTVEGRPLIPVGVHEFDEYGCDSFGNYLMNFLAVPYEKDGKYYDRFTDPEYLRWMKMFAGLGREGLLTNDIFIDKRVQMEEKIAQGRYFCMLYQRTDFVEEQKKLYQENPDKAYIAVDGPRNSEADPHTLPGGGINGWTVTLISKKSRHQEKALELMTYMMSEEGQKLTSEGIEGTDYIMVNGKAVLTEAAKKLIETDYQAYVETRGADNTYWMLQNNCMQMAWHDNTDPALRQMEEWTYPYTVYLGQYELQFNPGSKAGLIKQKAERAWGAILPQLLLSADDAQFDRLIEEYRTERDNAGYRCLEEEATRQIRDNKKRLGIG